MKSIFGTAYDKLSNIYTGVQSYFKTEQKPIENKLLKQIEACCYEKDKINVIHEAIEKVVMQYPQLESGLLTFSEDMEQKSLIQLQGSIPIQYKTKKYPVRVKIYIPQQYPKQSPMIRIINTDPSNYKINSVYQNGRSSNDPNSYVLVDLDAFKNWNPQYLDISSMILEAREKLGNNFPWRKITYSTNTKPRQPKNEQKLVQNKHNDIKDVVPKPSAMSVDLLDYQSHCKQLYKKLLSTIPNYSKNIEQLQTLQIANKLLDHQISLLKTQSKTIEQFIEQKQQVHNNIPLKQIVYTDGKDDMLIELVCQNKALGQQLDLLEKMFNSKQIQLNDFLKHVRRIEQAKFTTKYFIKYMMDAQLN